MYPIGPSIAPILRHDRIGRPGASPRWHRQRLPSCNYEVAVIGATPGGPETAAWKTIGQGPRRMRRRQPGDVGLDGSVTLACFESSLLDERLMSDHFIWIVAKRETSCRP